MGSGFWFAGNSVEGPGATILIRKDLLPGDFNGNAKINVSNIYIEGDIGEFDENGDPKSSIAQSVVIGSQVNPGDIIIDGNVFLAGNARIYGDNVYISGNVNLSASGAIIANNIYIRGNLEIIGGGSEKIIDKVYLAGTYTSSGYSFVPNFQEGEVLFPGVPEFGLPKPRSSDWYLANGYIKNGVLANNAKIFSDSTKKAWADGKFNNVKVGICKWYDYLHSNGTIYKVQGTWELEFIIWLDDQNINFLCHKNRLEYSINEEKKNYYPDFFVYEWNTYVDIKNKYHYSLNIDKFDALKKSGHNIKILK
jgi:hypothetical protein